MWRLHHQDDNDGDPLLRSLNGNVGRQVWRFDEKAGTAAERQEVERLRERFTSNRFEQAHSSDELLRLQCKKGRKVRARAASSSSSTPIVRL